MKNLWYIIIIIITLCSCDKIFIPDGEWETIMIEEGYHFPVGAVEYIDRLPVLKTEGELRFQHKFHTSYELNTKDSSSWNKLPGLSQNKIPGNSGEYGFNWVGFTFRYIESKDYYQIGVLANHSSKLVLKEYVADALLLPSIQSFEYTQDDIYLYFWYEGVLVYTWEKPKNVWYIYITNHYFGGMSPAPSTQEYSLMFY